MGIALSAVFAWTAAACPAEPGRDSHGDPLPKGAIARIGTLRFRAGSPINEAVLSPDGKLLATLANNGIFLFDSSDGRLVRTILDREVFGAFDYNMQRVAFSSDGRTLFGIAADGTVRAWETDTGRELWCFGTRQPGLGGQPRPVFADDFNVGGLIVLPADDGLLAKSAERVVLLKSATGEQIASWPATGYMAGVTPDGKTVYVFDEHASAIRHLDRITGQEVKLDRLARIDPNNDELRMARAIQVLELLRSERARAVLRAWASGQPRATLTEQAAAALARLDK
jgi:WD40 repeat protein